MSEIYYGTDLGLLYKGDACVVLTGFPNSYFDTVITDPPAGISFMGKSWDSDKGGRDKWVSWLTEIMGECLRVLKPGGMALVWCIPRTAHWTATAIEDAGFEIRDKIYHVFGQGMKKGLDVSKAIDGMKGIEREVVGTKLGLPGYSLTNGNSGGVVMKGSIDGSLRDGIAECNITVSATPEAQRFAGYGTGLKPSVEEWVLAMKPLDGNFAENAIKHGVAGLNIDGARITGPEPHHNYGRASGEKSFVGKGPVSVTPSQGRWPSNLLLSHHPECREIGVKRVKGEHRNRRGQYGGGVFGGGLKRNETEYAAPDGTETILAYECAAGCPCGHVWATKELTECPECGCRFTEWACAVRMLDEQAGELKSGLMKAGTRRQNRAGFTGTMPMFTKDDTFGDSGGPSRFYYCAKSSRTERELGLWGHIPCKKCGGLDTLHHTNDKGEKIKCVRNNHPTVKSLAIMEYLCKLTMTPDGGVVLDPFAGSGTTLMACEKLNRNWIGIELLEENCQIAKYRMEYVSQQRSSLLAKVNN